MGDMEEGANVQRPPLLRGPNYNFWKGRMRAFLKSQGGRVWRIIETGWTEPTETNAEVLQEKWTELLLVHRKNILEKNQLAVEVEDLRKKLDKVNQQLIQTEGEKSDLKYELTQLKSYQRWMKSAGAEKIEEMVSSSKFYGDRSGIGHTSSEGSKTPLDLFTRETRNITKQPDTKELPECNLRKGKDKVFQRPDCHRQFLNPPISFKRHYTLRLLPLGCIFSVKNPSIITIESANMVRTKIALPQRLKNPLKVKRNANLLKKFAQARAKLQTKLFSEEDNKASSPHLSHENSQQNPPHAESHEAQLDEAPLKPDLPTVFYLEYKADALSQRMQSTSDEIGKANEKDRSNFKQQDEPCKATASEPCQTEFGGDDEEFLNLLEEEPLMAVSEVPFQSQVSTPQNQKSTSKPSISNPVRWSKCKLESEIKTPEAPSPLSKKAKSSAKNFIHSTDENFEKVFVRGKYYDFSPAAVNKFLGVNDELDVQIGEATMWKELTHGARNSQQSTNKVPSSILNSSYSILLRVAACHWLATTHTNTVTKAMGMLLYKIKNGVPINLGKLIVSQIAEFGKRNYKQNDNGLPFPVLIFQMLLSQGFVKVAADKEEPPEPLLHIDYRHFEGNHFNDMESTQSSAQQGVSAVIQYLDDKLEANREEMRMTLAKQSALEEEHKHLTWLREVVTDSAATTKGESAQGESSQEEEEEDELSA
ncbi:hypothetical protein DM860_018206 [Cuscuta australis]|uniref:Putative plant transposon protein domain-containing protein n=1 Tax=Cuscuta australis TaxID=267555 RepID=A0A328EA51_9ASTE|nr:hypothetical protein DM860_018206 [Cuscuta australis]